MTMTNLQACTDDATCRMAATRAYAELRENGVGDQHAFGAAVRVFQYHHPEAAKRDATYIVADWLDPEAQH